VKALVVGAGIGGLAAGVALRRAGCDIRIVERASSPRELGFALNLAPNATAALRELGVADEVVRESATPRRFEIRRPDGRTLRRIARRARDTSRPDPHIVTLRTTLHGALLSRVEDALLLDSRAVGFEHDGPGVSLRLADGRTVSGDVLIGADGVGSVVRGQLHPDDSLRSSPYIALRGVAFGALEALGDLDAVAYLGAGVEAAMARASAQAIYWYVSLLSRDVDPRDREPLAVLARHTARFDPRFLAIVRATTPEDVRFDALVDRAPIEAWGRGRVTLLGDAAHPMLPHAGQGAAQALEDAVALGRVLARPGDVEAALRRYERVRAARTRRMVRTSRRIARTTTTRNPLVLAVRSVLIQMLIPGAVDALARLARRDPHRGLS
jgi:2-polyprenyl-6-methoxyphenol hydroxylase-like FAD-dependent oxidoreductase